MADYGWRNDSRRQWDEERDRFRDERDRYIRDQHSLGDRFGENWNRWNRDDFRSRPGDFGRGGEYDAGYSTPVEHARDLRHRPGGMRDDDWRGNERSGLGNRGNFADYRGERGAYPSDYQDYGDWQGQGGSRFGDYGGPRFGSNYPLYDRGLSGTGYGDYGNYGGERRGYSPGGNDYGDSRETNRNFWNRATDEVASWVGDRDAERRRNEDHMRGHSGRGPKGYVRSDDRIREDVNDRLTDDWRLDASNIDITVNNGEVTLAGTVSSRPDKRHAEDLVDSISGVKHVQNNLRVSDNVGSSLGDQSLSTPVGSSGANTSTAMQNRPAGYQSSTSATPSAAPGSSGNANSTH